MCLNAYVLFYVDTAHHLWGGRSSITGYPEGRVRSVIGARLRNSTGWSRKTGRRNGSKGRGRGPSASSAAWGGARSLRTPRRWPGPIPLVNSCVHDQIPRQVRRPHTRAVSINVIPAGDVSRTTGLRSTGPLQLDGPWVGPALQNGQGSWCPTRQVRTSCGYGLCERLEDWRWEGRGEEEGLAGEEWSELSGGSKELSLSPSLQTLPSPCFHWASRLAYLPGRCVHTVGCCPGGWMLALASARCPLTDQCVAGHPPTHNGVLLCSVSYFSPLPCDAQFRHDGRWGEVRKASNLDLDLARAHAHARPEQSACTAVCSTQNPEARARE